jgi:hypothetical protein
MSASAIRRPSGRSVPLRRILLAGPAAALFAALPLSANDDSRPSAVRSYDIPAMPLDAALSRYSETNGVDVLLDEPNAAGRRSTPVIGSFAAPQALVILLDGTGLVARFTSRNSAIITLAARTGRPLAHAPETGNTVVALDMMRVTAPRLIGTRRDPPDTGFLLQMAGRIRDRLIAGEVIDRARRPRMRVQTRIRSDGTLFEVRVAVPSADGRRDARIVALLNGASLGLTPPEGLRQPLLFDVDGR